MSKQISAWFLEQHLGEQAAQKEEEQRPLLCAQDTGQQIPLIIHELLFNCPLTFHLPLKCTPTQKGKTYQSNQRNSSLDLPIKCKQKNAHVSEELCRQKCTLEQAAVLLNSQRLHGD